MLASRFVRVQSKRRSGKVLVMIALAMPVIMGAGAMALDGGLMVSERRHAQSVADASALSAAYVMYNNVALGQALVPSTAAKTTAALNGYNNDGITSIVTTNVPPLTGTFAGKANYVEVIVTYKQPKMFSAIWGKGTNTVSARSVARTSGPSSGTPSVLLLSPIALGSLFLAGSAGLVTSGGIQVNSNSPFAAIATNMGYAKAPTINIVGSNTVNSSGYFSGAITNGSSSVTDPLTSIPVPDPSTMPGPTAFMPYGQVTLNPGVYPGGLNFGGGSNVTLNQGIYYMKNGSFNVANGVTLNGSGVMIYVDGGGGSLSFQGGGVINLTPPSTGPYAGISYYQARSSISSINIANGSTATIAGTIYAPSAPMNFAGGALFTISAPVVVSTLNLSNNAQVRVNSGSGGGGGHVGMGLVE